VALDTIAMAQQQHGEFCRMRKAGVISKASQVHVDDSLKYQIAFLKALLKRSESNTKRIQNEIALVG
jgi:hypothetical protein